MRGRPDRISGLGAERPKAAMESAHANDASVASEFECAVRDLNPCLYLGKVQSYH